VDARDDRRDGQPSIKVEATWRPGARTPAWDVLWRQIIADLGGVLDEPSIDDSDLTLPPAAPDKGEV